MGGRTNGARPVPLRCMPQREIYKPPVRGGVLDAPPSVDGRRRLHTETLPTHRRGGLPRPPGLGMKDDIGRPFEMVRGLCPRDFICWAVKGFGRTVVKAGAIGQAERMRLMRPGNPANAGRRGRRPLRAGAKPRYQHRGKQMRKGENLRSPLGSPERGAVAARSGVTEGLRPTSARAYQRYPSTHATTHRRGGKVGARNRRRRLSGGRRTEDGAPYGARRNVQQQTHVVGYPTEGASRTPPPTVGACGYVSAEP